MSVILREKDLQALRKRVTTFKTEDAYITFYYEKDYQGASTPRSSLTPVGSYLFWNAFTLDENFSLLTPQQALGKSYKNLRPVGYVDSRFSVSGLYTQEGSDLDWLKPGHPPLLCFVDFVDALLLQKMDDDVLDPLGNVQQTLVIRDARLGSKKIQSEDAAGVTLSLDFTAGEVVRLNSPNEEFTGDPLFNGGSNEGSALFTDRGFGFFFGVAFGS